MCSKRKVRRVLGQVVHPQVLVITLRDAVPDDAVEHAFVYLDDSDGIAATAIGIGDYYNAVGHTDSVYRVHGALAANPEQVPIYGQLLVDEYQDFNLLEATIIDQLAQVSPVLIAGDDDQALYGFKHASTDYLRNLVGSGDYERFELACCTRCTQVLVDATHRIVAKAQRGGLLANRIEKQYICYLPEKRAPSEKFPKILHARCTVERNTAPYMCRYVAQAIGRIDQADVALSWEKGHPTVLVMGPTQFVRRVYKHLFDQGVPNIEFRSSSTLEIDVLDGYRRLLKDERSRLGWRLTLQSVQFPNWEDLVRQALLVGTELADLLSEDFRNLHLSIVNLLRQLIDDQEIADPDRGRLEAATGLPFPVLRKQLGLDPEDPAPEEVHDAPKIVITTLLGAKGLQAEHTFVVGCNDGHFPSDNAAPTEDEVCQLLVALTRARQSCTLVSCGRFGTFQLNRSAFIGWLGDLVDPFTIDAAYWRGGSN
jgi:UvrD/REP helicase N-terminal domain